METKEILSTLGLDRLPDPRYQVSAPHETLSGARLLNHKKALKLVDPIESAAFMRFAPDDIVIDQSLDPRVFSSTFSKAVMIRTDVKIPSGPKVFAATGIGTEPTAENHYRWLWVEVRKYIDGLGASAVSPVLITRTHGSDSTVPLLIASFKLDIRAKEGETIADQAATWALLGPRAPEVRLREDESLADVK